jgi:hypothetical protein
MMLLIALWATVAVWSEDPLGKTAGGPHTQVYWTLVALIALIEVVCSLRDLIRKSQS